MVLNSQQNRSNIFNSLNKEEQKTYRKLLYYFQVTIFV